MTDRNREPFSSLVLYRFLKWSFIIPVLYSYFRGRVYGAEKIPQDGSFILVCNHASNLDPPLISVSACRPISFMAKEELFRVPGFKQLIEGCGAYPVKRDSSDRTALKAAMKYLKEGWAAGIFLQGTRTDNGKITDPKLGAALIAAKTKSPLIPVSIWGTEKLQTNGGILPAPITIRFGDIIPYPQSTKKAELQAVTEHCAEVINGMHDLGR